MKDFIAKVIAFFKLITPWIKFGVTEFKKLSADLKVEKAKRLEK